MQRLATAKVRDVTDNLIVGRRDKLSAISATTSAATNLHLNQQPRQTRQRLSICRMDMHRLFQQLPTCSRFHQRQKHMN